MATWATPTEASTITGKTLYQADLDAAQSMIDLFTDTHIGIKDSLQPRTIRILKQALSWQAVWQKEQGGTGDDNTFGVDTIEKTSETLGDYSYSKGSPGSGSGGSTEDQAMLSPIAQRWITKLKWKRTRTIDPLTASERVLLEDGELDGIFPWFPLGPDGRG